MVVTHQIAGDSLVIAVQGEISMFTVADFNTGLTSALESCATRRIILDLAEVPLIDSTGLGALVGLLKQVQAEAGSVSLVRLRAGVTEIMRITKLLERFRIYDNLEDAINTPAPESANI